MFALSMGKGAVTFFLQRNKKKKENGCNNIAHMCNMHQPNDFNVRPMQQHQQQERCQSGIQDRESLNNFVIIILRFLQTHLVDV